MRTTCHVLSSIARRVWQYHVWGQAPSSSARQRYRHHAQDGAKLRPSERSCEKYPIVHTSQRHVDHKTAASWPVPSCGVVGSRDFHCKCTTRNFQLLNPTELQP